MEIIKTRVKIFGPANEDHLEEGMNDFFIKHEKDRVRVTLVVPLSKKSMPVDLRSSSLAKEDYRSLAVFYEML